MIGEKYISKLLNKAVRDNNSSLNKAFIDGLMPLYGNVFSSIPIIGFDNLSQAVYDAYCKSDLIYSIVNRKAKAGARTTFGVYKIKSLKAKKEYDEYRVRKDARLDKMLELKEAAIEPTGHYLNDKFQDPNGDTSQSEYLENLLTYLNVTGNCYEYLIKNGLSVLQMHSLAADRMEILPDNLFPMGAKGYKLNLGTPKDLELEEIIHAKYVNPRATIDGKQLYGMSPIMVLWNLLQGDEEGNDMIAEVRKHRGPRKLVGIENDKITDYLQGEKMSQGLKSAFNERSRDHKDRTMAVWGKITTHDMTFSGDASEMAASSTNFFQRACGVFSVPHQWVISLQNEAKFSNFEQYAKQALINGVFPDLNKIRDARNRKFRKLGQIKDSQAIDYDESVYSELEVDKAEMMKWLDKAPYSPDEQRVFLGDKATNKPGMDEYLAPRNKVPVSELKNIKNGKQTGQNDTATSEGTSGTSEGQSGQSN